MEIDPIPAGSGLDMFVCRSRYESAYVDAILDFPERLIESLQGITGVRQQAILLQRPLVRREFRYLSRRSNYGLQYVPGERWERSRWGQAVLFQCPQIEYMSRDARRRAFCRLPDAWFNY